CRLAGVKQAALGPDHAELSLPKSERSFFRDRASLRLAFSLDALERDPDAEIAVLGSPFLSQLIEAIRARAARLSLGLIAPPATAASDPGGVELTIPVRDGTVTRGATKVALHPVGRLVARVVLRAGAGGRAPRCRGAGARRRARQVGSLLRVDPEGAIRSGGNCNRHSPRRATPHRGDPARPGEGGRASVAAHRRGRPHTARRVAARVVARASGDVQRAAVSQWCVGLVARVSPLRPPADDARCLPARALRLRRLLAPLLGLCRGLLRGPRYRGVSGGRSAGV